LLLCASLSAQTSDLTLDITGTSLIELMNLKITSLSKKQQPLNKAAAAVYVLSSDEIQRLGVTHIADALRYVPGVEVARIDASRWSISLRGFNGRAANKLLVMIDGRSVYSPLFSGVLWEEKDVLLADVERIEVIRGPGSAIWGANAVNGVINIITKSAQASQGTLVELSVGLEQQQVLQARYGWQVDDNGFMRIYAKHRQHRATNHEFSNDDNQQNQFGFRFDYDFAPDNTLSIHGDIYSGDIGSLDSVEKPDGQKQSGGNLLLNWQIADEDKGKHKLLAYYDQTSLTVPILEDRRKIVNLDYQFEQQFQHHTMIAGLGYRSLRDEVDTQALNFIQPRTRHDQISSAFIQDDISLLDDDLHIILGAKYEHNDYSGAEWQPNVRLSYQLAKSLLWASWSKAVRVPTRFESDFRYGSFSGEQLQSEQADVYELGWRKQWTDTWSLDTTVYSSQYDNLQSIEATGYGNKLSGHVQGIEISSSVQLQAHWLLRFNFSHANMYLSADSDSISQAMAEETQGKIPKNMLQVISMWDINQQWQFNSFVRYVDELSSNDIDSYWSVDLSLRWQFSEGFSSQVVARNVGAQHEQWDPLVPVESDIVIKFRWEM
jgi:iron complex outermembrane receptor protein